MTAKQLTGEQSPDGSLYVTLTDGAGNLVTVSGGGGGSPGGSSGQVQYNSAASFGGITGTFSDGTNLTMGATALRVLGSSTGYTTIESANSSSSNYVATFPAATDTVVELTQTQTLTNKTLTSPTLTTPVLGVATATSLDGAAIGAITASTGAFTTLSASSTVSGTGFSTYLASPPAIGGTTAAAGTFTTLNSNNVNTIALGTITTNIKALNITATWNASGTTFDAPLFMNVTNTAETTGSNLIDVQLNGNPAMTLNTGASTTQVANLRVYNTSSSANANYERGVFGWTDNSNVLTIGTQAGGTGSARNMEFVIGGTNQMDYGVTSSGHWFIPAAGAGLRFGTSSSTILADFFGYAAAINMVGSKGITWDTGTTTLTGTVDLSLFRASPSVLEIGNSSSAGAGGSLLLTNLTASGVVASTLANLTVYTVTTLPSTGRVTGSVALVSDATSNVLIGSGGGSAYALVAYNGSAWVAV